MRQPLYKATLLSIFFFLCQPTGAQLLFIGAESEVIILGGTDFAVDQLVLIPTWDYSIRNNNLSVTKSNLFSSGKSVSKTYLFEQNPLPFYGRVMMGVADTEVNPEYSLQLFDNIRWNAVETKSNLLNRHLLEGSVASGKVTKAITVGQANGKGDFEIVTNPAIYKIVTVRVHKPGEYQFLSSDGKLLINQKLSEGLHQINLNRFAHSSYLLTNRITTKSFIL